jgi:uncharacterized protein YqgC (DUF456 family)
MPHFTVFYFFTSAKCIIFYPLLAYLKYFTSAKSGIFYIDLAEVKIMVFTAGYVFSAENSGIN